VVFAAGDIIASRPYGSAKTIPEVSIRCAESSLFTACGARVRFSATSFRLPASLYGIGLWAATIKVRLLSS
jgi:hypothetical protein